MINRILLTAVAAAVAVAAHAAPVARWLSHEYDFGAFDETTGIVRCQFKAVNDGNEPLVVLSARANCGCTKPEYSPEPVAPGDTLVINVGYDPEGRPGRFTKHVKVTTNAEVATAEFTIRGTVIATSKTIRGRYPIDLGPVKMRDKVIALGEVIKGKSLGGYVEGYNQSKDTIVPVLSGVPSYVSAVVQPARVAPGEQFIVSAVVHTGKIPRWGIFTEDFYLSAGADSNETMPVSLVMILKEDFSGLTPGQLADAPVVKIVPEKVDLGTVEAGKDVVAEFEISNAGKNTLEIRDVNCPDSSLTFKVKSTKVKKGKSTKVTVTIPASALHGHTTVNERVTVITNDPSTPTAYVRIVGLVK